MNLKGIKMQTLLRPIQEVPEKVKEQAEKHSQIYLWSVIIGIIIAVFAALHLFTIRETNNLQVKNEELSIDVQNLKLFQTNQARLVQLEQMLLANKGIKEKIGQDNVPLFAFKVLSLAEQYQIDGVSAPLILGLIEVESDFNPKAVSETGALGLMQVVRATATPYLRAKGRAWSQSAMFDPNINVQIGVDFLVDLHRQYIEEGKETKNEFIFSLLAYNQGPTAVNDVSKRKDKIYLNYPVKVKLAARKWSALGI